MRWKTDSSGERNGSRGMTSLPWLFMFSHVLGGWAEVNAAALLAPLDTLMS